MNVSFSCLPVYYLKCMLAIYRNLVLGLFFKFCTRPSVQSPSPLMLCFCQVCVTNLHSSKEEDRDPNTRGFYACVQHPFILMLHCTYVYTVYIQWGCANAQ